MQERRRLGPASAKNEIRMVNSRRDILADVRRGVRGGLAFAALYSLWISGIYLLQGSRPFEELHVTFISAVVLYVVIGVVAGAIVGLLLPLTSSRVGAYLVGVIAAVPVAVGIGVGASGTPNQWDYTDWGATAIMAIAACYVIGSELWKSANASVYRKSKRM